MLGLTRETQMDKARKTLRNVVSYVEDVTGDERLRADVRDAAIHGAKASERVRKDLDGDGITSRLADDKKLRKNLRAMLDDLDSAADRVRGKKRHRTRNILVLFGAIAAAFLVARLWLSGRLSDTSPDYTETAPTV
jgi:hypothetical protein